MPRRRPTRSSLVVAAVLALACGSRDAKKAAPADAAPVTTPPTPVTSVTTGTGVMGTPPGVPSDFVALARGILPSVVTVRAAGGASLGSGFAIDEEHVLTNAHVVAGARGLSVVLAGGDEAEAEVTGADAPLDVALLHVRNAKLTPVPLGDSDALGAGEWIIVIGSPFGLEHTVTAGIVSAVGRSARDLGAMSFYQSFIQTDASINPGNSGGPVVNTGGQVVGIATAVDLRGAGIGYAIPISMVKQILPMLQRDGRVTRAYLGVVIAPVTATVAAQLGLPRARGGALVVEVSPGSPAARADLRPGDVILTLDGAPVDDRSLPWKASTAGIGEDLELRVWREGAEIAVTITTAALPT